MSRRIVVVLALIIAVICSAAAFVWLHAGGQRKTSVQFTPDPPASHTNVSPQPASPATAASPKNQPGTSAASKTASDSSTALVEPVFSPVQGEVLEFNGSVAKVSNVATLRLTVNGRKDIGGKDAWHLQAFAHTQNPLRMVFELDDQFDSYSVPGDFSSMQYEMRLNERGQKVTSLQRLTPTGRDVAPAGVSATLVSPGTRDPLGMMQYLRSVDWTKVSVVRGPVYDGRKLYEVRAQKIGSAEVQVPVGKFSTNTIEISVLDHGVEMKDAHFTLYLAKDAARTPVLLKAVLPFADALVELAKRQP
jgi:hypothetical protein